MAVKGKTAKKNIKNKKKDTKPKKFSPILYAKLWETRLRSTEESRSQFINLNAELMKENETLKQKFSSSNQDILEIVGHFKTEDIQNTIRIKQLEQQIAELTVSYQQETHKIKRETQAEIESIRGQAEAMENDFDQVRAELNSLNEFYSIREKIVLEMETIKEGAERTVQEHRKEVENMKNDHQKESTKIKEYMMREIERIKLNALDEALKSLQEADVVVYEENLRLSDLAVQNSTTIAKLRTRLEDKGHNLLVLKNDNEVLSQDFENVTLRKIKSSETQEMLECRVYELEGITEKLKNEHNTALNCLNQKWTQQCDVQVVKNKKLALILDQLLKENKKFKKLSNKILENRTDIEKFFLQGIEHVQSQINSNLRIKDTEEVRVSRHVKFPPIGASRGEMRMNCVERVRMEDLSWEQKEGVLKFMFGRFNMTEAFKNY